MATFLNYFDRQTIGVAVGPIAKELDLDGIQRGNLLSAFLFTYAAAHLFIGFIIDRIYNIRFFYAFMVVGWSLSTILVGFSNDYATILWLRYALGLWEAVNFPMGIMLIARIFPQKERSLATGIFGSGAFLATLLTPKTIIYFSNAFDWRMGFIFAGALGFLWLVPWFLIFKNPWAKSQNWVVIAKRVDNKTIGNPLEVLKNPGTWLVAIMGMGLIPCLYFSTQWLPTYFTDTLGLAFDQRLGDKLMLVYLMLDIGLWVGGFLVLKLVNAGNSVLFSRKLVIGIGYLFIISVLIVPFITDIWWIILFFGLFVFGIGMFLANQHAFKQDVVLTQVAAVSAIVGFVEMIFTAFFIQWIGKFSGENGNFNVVFYVMAAGVTMALGVVILGVGPKFFKLNPSESKRKSN